MKYFYLVYSSVPTVKLTDQEIENLLIVARRENEARNITGMLICLPEMYVQLIEGEESHIQQLYENLKKDERHYRVTTLKQGPVEKRFFPEWTMGFDQKDIKLRDLAGSFDVSDQKVFQLFNILDDGFG